MFHVRCVLRRAIASVSAAALFAASLPLNAHAQTLPSNGRVVAGSANIGTPSNGNLTVNQSSNRAVINWNAFSIGAQNSVTFNQPGTSSAVLNRVTGDTTSVIAGKLSANGQVFLVNPNGIAITPTGKVDVGGGFVASSLGIRTRDFMDGNLAFSGTGGAVTNAGSISVGAGGFAALLGGSVSNSGTITVPQGRVGLGAGSRATLDLTGDGFLQIASGSAGGGSGVTNMTGGQLRQAVRNVVNMGGSATTVSGTHGRIVLGHGGPRYAASKRIVVANAGAVTNSGTIVASGGKVVLSGTNVTVDKGSVSTANPTGKGGSIVLSATDTITLLSANLDASGATGGGNIKIGGDYQGTGPLPRARLLTVDAGSVIRADAITSGDGGRVILWSDGKTVFNGLISARGGAQSGDGGFAEVSGKGTLVYTGAANLTAPRGDFGTLLLDPYNITISGGADTTSAGFAASGNDSVINVTTLVNALNYANVEVKTGAAGSAGAQAGNITLTTPLMWSTRATLSLTAANNIALNDKITAPNGRLELNAGGVITSTADILLGTFILNSGAWTQNAANLPRFDATDFRINGGTFLRATGGDGTQATPYTLIDIYGVQGMRTFPLGDFALAADIDARGTAGWNNRAGFLPVGMIFNGSNLVGQFFSGSFDGRGHLISGLTINRPDTSLVGLFGMIRNAKLMNFGLENVNITGDSVVGAAVGRMLNGSTLSRTYSTGLVNGNTTVGGLVGSNAGTISDSYSSATVSGGFFGSAIGGLVGFNDSSGTITNAYALGSVSGGQQIGGLVGVNNRGTITSTYASGKVNGSGGGLVGDHIAGTISNSVWDVTSTGQSDAIGPDTGQGQGTATNVNSVDAATRYAQAPYTGSNFDFTNTWFMIPGSTRPMLRSEYSTIIRNAHQLQLMAINTGANHRLGADIDASATTGANASGIWSTAGFSPIGSANNPFVGAFDGEMHVIDKLTINRPNPAINVGLFSTMNGTVSNVGLTNASIIGGTWVGAVAGRASRSIFNVYSTGNVSGDSNIGGLVGQLSSTFGLIENSYSSATVTGRNSSGTGGLVGGADAGTKIKNSYATGAVIASSAGGGLVGDLAGTIETSYASGAVSGAPNLAGGLVGFIRQGGVITSSFWDRDSTGRNAAVGNVANVPGATGITAANRYIQPTYAGFDFANMWFLPGGSTRPLLRSEYSTSIHNAHQLQLMALNLSANYTLANTINASATVGTNASDIWGTAGFVPVGPFNGALRGLGYTINNLSINRPGISFIGLFSFISAGGLVSVDLVQPSITANSYVGAIAGINSGIILSSNVRDGTVNAGSISGGLAGSNTGSIIASSSSAKVSSTFAILGGLTGDNSGFIGGSSSTGDVIGGSQSSSAGGIAGTNFSAATILASFATGKVFTGGDGGGLVGRNNGTIELSYATGAISGPQFVTSLGGLVGVNLGAILNAYARGDVSGFSNSGGLVGRQTGGSITNAYATGKVSVSGTNGGLFGFVAGGNIANVYWDKTTTGQQNAAGSIFGGTLTNVTGYTTAEMQNLDTIFTTYKGFDFAKVWWPASNGSQNDFGQSFYPELYMLSYVLTYKPGDTTATYGQPRPNIDLKLYGGVIPPRRTDPAPILFDFSGVTQSASGNDNAGTYLIPALRCVSCTVGSDDGEAYRYVVLPGTYVVKPLEVTVTAVGGSSTQGQAPTNPGLQFGSISPGDNPSLVFGGLTNSFGIGPNTQLGSYTLSVLGQSGDPNYVIVRFDGTWVVKPGGTGPTASANTPTNLAPAGTSSEPVCSATEIAEQLRTRGKAPLFDPQKGECAAF